MDIKDKEYMLNRMDKIIHLFLLLKDEAKSTRKKETIFARPFMYTLFYNLMPDFYKDVSFENLNKNMIFIDSKTHSKSYRTAMTRDHIKKLFSFDKFLHNYLGIYCNPKVDTDDLYLGPLFSSNSFYFEDTTLDSGSYEKKVTIKKKNASSGGYDITDVLNNSIILFSSKGIRSKYRDSGIRSLKNDLKPEFDKFIEKSKPYAGMFNLNMASTNYPYCIFVDALITVLDKMRHALIDKLGIQYVEA